MRRNALSVLIGFTVLFSCYHAAEYMILFKNSVMGFLLFQGLFFIGAWAIAKQQFGTGLSAWGLDRGKHLGRHLLLGVVMGILLYGITFALSLLLGVERISSMPPLADALPSLGLFVFGSFFSSLSEDVLTRGYVFKHSNGKISHGPILALSATIYLLNHIYRLGDGVETYLYLLALGILFAIPLILTRRLWFTGGLHWAGNFTFYGTHEIIRTEEHSSIISPNYILVALTLLFIPLNYYLLKRLKLIPFHKAHIGAYKQAVLP